MNCNDIAENRRSSSCAVWGMVANSQAVASASRAASQALSCLRAFALALPSARNALTQALPARSLTSASVTVSEGFTSAFWRKVTPHPLSFLSHPLALFFLLAFTYYYLKHFLVWLPD